jgi:hypothetical protein
MSYRHLAYVLVGFMIVAIVISLTPPSTLAYSQSPVAPPMSFNSGLGHPACADVTLENSSTPACDALMASQPHPNVEQLPTDLGIVSEDVFMRFNTNRVPVYNAPNGRQLDTLITGYTYVAPRKIEDGWAEIRPGQWISTTYTRSASPSGFAGVRIGSMDMPFAWILWPHDARFTPAGQSDREHGHYERFQLVNIYATVNVRGWNWHLIGPDHWTNQQNLSIVYPGTPADYSGHWVAINLYEQNLVAYDGGMPAMATLVSSGLKNGRWDTPTGTYQIGVRVEAGIMSGAEGRADYYSLDKVPYAQYFNGLISLHGTYWHQSFGYPQSHGCVNLSVSDAKWLYEQWLGEGSTVYVY